MSLSPLARLEVDVIPDQIIRELAQHVGWALLSAELPNFSKAENEARSLELYTTLSELPGATVVETTTVSPVSKEDTFLVFGISKETALELMKKYDQDSIIYGGYVFNKVGPCIWLNSCELLSEPPNDRAYIVMPGGRIFTFDT